MAVLALLIVVSAVLFWSRFGKVVQVLRQAKPEADFSLHPIGKRVWDFFWEVICQSKVIKERPIPGLAHAFVFWGFLAFALVSLNHFATGFNLGFLSPDGVFGGFYFYFAAVFALMVAVGITWLFIRRFFLRPKWLGEKLSYGSGVVAGLIFLLMATYLAGFFTPRGSTAALALWWVHALTILVFLPLIPHTKHLHLMLAPATVFLSRGEFSRIPPLAGDEDFGLVTGKDITKLAALQAYSCVECGRCTEHCPANNTGKELNPKQIVLGLRGFLNDLGPGSEELVVDGKHETLTSIFQCTTCGACEYQCPVGIEHVPLIVGMRRGTVNTGVWEDEYGGKLFNTLERNGNALGMSATERDKFIQKEELPIFDGTQEYCLWLGCMGAYDPQGREIVASFAKVMRYLGTSFGVLKKERCTGDPVRRLGNDLLFQTLAEQNIENIQKQKVKKIVTICPHCVRTMAKDWQEYGGVTAEIEHHSEFMARHQHLLPQSHSEETIVYHDPCYLGRYRGSYDEPREVLARSGKVIDPPRSHERSFCCGAGGGLVFLGEEQGDRVSHTRARELTATGAKIVGAACPFCNTMFRDALAATSDAPPELLDIAQIAARSIEGASAKPNA
jgi:Fe-S oxidoreductase